jgi:hypothetical protein
MSDVYLCAHCGSTNLMHEMDAVQCLACGNRTDLDYPGHKLPTEPQFEGENPHNRRPM